MMMTVTAIPRRRMSALGAGALRYASAFTKQRIVGWGTRASTAANHFLAVLINVRILPPATP